IANDLFNYDQSDSLLYNLNRMEEALRLPLFATGPTLLVHPGVDEGRVVVVDLVVLEPVSDLAIGGVDRVGSVADVASGLDGIVSADGSGGGGQGVGGSEHSTSLLDDVKSLPDHGDDGSRLHVGDERGEEGLLLEVDVVLLKMSLGGSHLLEGDQLVAALLEALDDLADESTVDAVRLDHDE
ncbi:hypothetical protein PENTCL1PPCAC_21240, partial [Pristionchus entomophagus]